MQRLRSLRRDEGIDTEIFFLGAQIGPLSFWVVWTPISTDGGYSRGLTHVYGTARRFWWKRSEDGLQLLYSNKASIGSPLRAEGKVRRHVFSDNIEAQIVAKVKANIRAVE